MDSCFPAFIRNPGRYYLCCGKQADESPFYRKRWLRFIICLRIRSHSAAGIEMCSTGLSAMIAATVWGGMPHPGRWIPG